MMAAAFKQGSKEVVKFNKEISRVFLKYAGELENEEQKDRDLQEYYLQVIKPSKVTAETTDTGLNVSGIRV